MLYNAIAGQNRARLEALSDGLFAFAMTLLVLDLRVPSALGIRTEGELLARACAFGAALCSVSAQLHDAWDLLDRSADAAQRTHTDRPEPDLAAPRVLAAGDARTVLDVAAG